MGLCTAAPGTSQNCTKLDDRILGRVREQEAMERWSGVEDGEGRRLRKIEGWPGGLEG